jgi:Domain of unknown function (DUF929)
VSNRPSKKRSSSARVQAAARADKSSNMPWIIGIGVMLVIGIALIVAVAGGSSSSGGDIVGRKSAPTALVTKVTSVPDTVINSIGQGSAAPLPTPINGPSVGSGSKPGVLYIGAEYCPHCAAERWAMLNALSRFGTFTGIKITNSAPTDGDVRTLSFYKSTYNSDYVDFQPVEQFDNSHNPLETVSSSQNAIEAKFNSNSSIPFIYFDGKYVLSGATYQYPVLQGKTWDQIAAALSDKNSAIAKAAIGSANIITATICILTNDQPSNTCSQPAIKSLETQIKAQSSTTTTTNANSSTP